MGDQFSYWLSAAAPYTLWQAMRSGEAQAGLYLSERISDGLEFLPERPHQNAPAWACVRGGFSPQNALTRVR
jgi:hypothetical protein